MDIATLLGLVGALVVIGVVMIMDGGSPMDLFAHPSALLLIVGGSILTTTTTSSLDTLKKLPTYFKLAMNKNKFNSMESIDLLVRLADKARRDGLLALEEETKKITDPFLQKGLMMVVDGTDSTELREILEIAIEQTHERHKVGIGFFASAGGYAPTFGIIGTVMGLISVLKTLDDAATFTKSIAAAFLATLWGLLFANVVYLPISQKLKAKSEEELKMRYMQIDGILSIQAGANPRIVREKLLSYLSPAELKLANKETNAKQPAGAPQREKA